MRKEERAREFVCRGPSSGQSLSFQWKEDSSIWRSSLFFPSSGVRESVSCYLMTLPSTGKSERLLASIGLGQVPFARNDGAGRGRRDGRPAAILIAMVEEWEGWREGSYMKNRFQKGSFTRKLFELPEKKLFSPWSKLLMMHQCTADSLQSTSLSISSLSCFISLLSKDTNSLRPIRAH